MYYLLLHALPSEITWKDLLFVKALEPETCAECVRQQEVPENVPLLSFLIDPGDPHLDYFRISNTTRGVLCSSRFLTILRNAAVPYRAYPAQLLDSVTQEVLSPDYAFWIPEEIENAIDWKQSDIEVDPITGSKYLTRMVLTKECQVSAPLLFKAKEKVPLLVDESIRRECLRIGIKGIAFAPLNAVFRPQWGDKLLDAQQQVQNHPDDWEAWDRLSDIFTFLHRYEESLDAINHALMIEQEISKLWYKKGELLYLLQQSQEALKALTRATELDQHSFAWGKYSRVLRELGRTQEAVDIAKRFVQFQGESPLSWQELGNAYATIGDNEEALEAFEKALSLGKGVEFPGVKELYMVQAEVLSRMGRYEEALAAYSHPFLSLRSQDSTVWRAKARVLRTLGRHDEEVQAEQKAQELEDRKARNLQARPH